MTPSSLEEVLDAAGIHDPAMLAWAREPHASIDDAWAECPRGEWLVSIAAHVGVDRRVVVRAAADCALHVLPHAAAPEVAARSWDAIEGWLRGERSAATCRATASAAQAVLEDLSGRDEPRAIALSALVLLVQACDDRTPQASWAARAEAAEAVVRCARALIGFDVRMAESLANVVRDALPFSAVRPAIAAAAWVEATSTVRRHAPLAEPADEAARGEKSNGNGNGHDG